jgi:hypothetical protein
LEPLGPGGSRRYRTATFDVRAEKARAEPLLLAPPDAVPVLDGVFLLRPQLNDAWGLRIFLEVDFQETLGCPTLDSRTSMLGLRAKGAMLPHGPLCALSRMAWCRRGVPRMS